MTPCWRTLKSGGEVNPSNPGGIEAQKIRLLSEGHKLVGKGRKHIVRDCHPRPPRL